MQSIRNRLSWRSVVAMTLLGLLTSPGCGEHKSPLSYVDESLGFSFTPPAGWRRRIEGAPRPTRNASPIRERELVRYKRLQADLPAWVGVSVADAVPTTNPATILAQRTAGGGWQQSSRIESTTVSGRPAARITMTAKQGKRVLTREAIAVRADQRIYFLTGTYTVGDTAARDQIRGAMASASWGQAAVRVASR
jgi:hypothetical protein